MLAVTGKPHPLPRSLAEWAERGGSCHQHLDTRLDVESSRREELWVKEVQQESSAGLTSLCSQLEIGRCWQADTLAGRSQGKDCGSPKGKAEGQCSGPSQRVLTSLQFLSKAPVSLPRSRVDNIHLH